MSYRYYSYDYRSRRKWLGWNGARKEEFQELSARLIFYFHKLEKGMCIPEDQLRVFGEKAARETMQIMEVWVTKGYPTESRVYRGAMTVISCYRDFLLCRARRELGTGYESLVSDIDSFLKSDSVIAEYKSPVGARNSQSFSYPALRELFIARRSVRSYKSTRVNIDDVKKAIDVASLSPSACNRQPWKVHIYTDRDQIKELLSLQNGNSGFGHTIPMLAIVCSDLISFSDLSERNEPYLDGGLFTMSFILSLQSLGLSTCCLNWCVAPSMDKKLRNLTSIKDSEVVLTFMAIGYASDNAKVPYSIRKDCSEILEIH